MLRAVRESCTRADEVRSLEVPAGISRWKTGLNPWMAVRAVAPAGCLLFGDYVIHIGSE